MAALLIVVALVRLARLALESGFALCARPVEGEIAVSPEDQWIAPRLRRVAVGGPVRVEFCRAEVQP